MIHRTVSVPWQETSSILPIKLTMFAGLLPVRGGTARSLISEAEYVSEQRACHWEAIEMCRGPCIVFEWSELRSVA
jgi:hypothetical protein